jgi:hypothetical protein
VGGWHAWPPVLPRSRLPWPWQAGARGHQVGAGLSTHQHDCPASKCTWALFRCSSQLQLVHWASKPALRARMAIGAGALSDMPGGAARTCAPRPLLPLLKPPPVLCTTRGTYSPPTTSHQPPADPSCITHHSIIDHPSHITRPCLGPWCLVVGGAEC